MQAGSGGQVAAKLPASQPEFVAMPQITDKQDVCCVALELSQSKWLCAFAPPEGAKLTLHTIKAGDHARMVEWLDRQRVRAEVALGRPLQLLGSVEIHRELMTAATRWIIAWKLWSVLSARMAIRLNSLSLQKKFSIR
jgi:hypothetical protein